MKNLAGSIFVVLMIITGSSIDSAVESPRSMAVFIAIFAVMMCAAKVLEGGNGK